MTDCLLHLLVYFPHPKLAPTEFLIHAQVGLATAEAWRDRARTIQRLRETQTSPVDLTVGWRLMSDQTVLDQLEIYRGYRMFYWRPKSSHWPAPHADITAHVANTHIIPASDEIDSRLKSMRPGNLIDLRGFLVLAEGADGWIWRSSLSRTDEGPGACELVWVDQLTAR
jgi:hypothetical protein